MSLGCHLEYEGVSRNLVRLRTLFAVLLFAFAMQQSEDLLHAQTNVGKILGIVRDQSGGVVPNAAVTARVVSTGVQMAATTYSDGSYSFPSLPIGEYAVTVRATGFKTAERPGVHVVASEAVTIDFQLEVGETTQSVQVVGQATKVDTTTTTSGTTILASEIANLPLLIQGGARSGLDFIGTLPGVIGGTMGTINGGPEGGVGYLLDGTMGAYAGHGLTGDSFGMPPEGLAEIRLNATNDSEFGATNGIAITAVTKSGTNQLHGDVYWYLRRQFLNAACYFCAGHPDLSNQNEEGFTVGGPVLLPKIYDGRNKTFFFGVFSKFSFRTQAGGTVLTVPTAKMRAGDFSEWLPFGPSRVIYDPTQVIPNPDGHGFVRVPFPGNIIPSDRFSKISTYYQGFVPLPNQPGLVNNWVGQTVPGSTDNHKYLTKIDHNFAGGRQRVSVAFDHSKTWALNPGIWSGPLATGSNNENFAFRVRANWQVTLGANKVFSLRAAINRTYFSSSVAPNPQSAVGGTAAGWKGVFQSRTPSITFDGGSTGFGAGGGAGIASFSVNSGDTGYTQDILPVNADLSWAKGKHSLKFGFAYANNTVVSHACGGCTGHASFGGVTSSGLAGSLGHGYADYLLGYTAFMTLMTPLDTKYLNDLYGFYGEDSWRVTPKLTLDIGLRSDVALPPHEAHDRASYVDFNAPNPGAGGLPGARSFFGTCAGCNGMHRLVDTQHPLSPHLGFAYQLRPQTVIRGGYGTSTVNLLGLFESGINLVGGGGSIGYAYTAFFFDQPTGITDTPYNWDGGFPLAIPPLPNLSPNISNNTTVASWLPHDFKAGRTQNISFGVEQELPHSFVVKLGYVGNLSHGQPAAYITVYSSIDPKYASLGNVLSESVTSADAVAAGIKVPYPGFVGTVARSLSKYPQFVDTYNIAEHIGFSLYHSFQATVQKRYGDLSFLSSYTISKQLDNYNSFGGLGEAYTFGMVQNNAFVSKYKKPADNDLPQMLVASWVYHLPFGPGKKFINSTNPVVRQAVGGWRLAAIQRYQSGGIINVSQSKVSIPGFKGIWPDRVLGVPIGTGVSCGNYDPGNPATNKYLNVAAFADPPLFHWGNTKTLPSKRMCGYFNEDVSLQKEFQIHERLSLEIAADAQNLFNRHAWTGLGTNIDAVAGFGQFTGTTGPRLMQLHMKFVF